MPMNVLGRTNREFSPIWLSLSLPAPHCDSEALDTLTAAALESGSPIDISSQPALWGGRLRGSEATLTTLSTLEYANAVDEKHASDLVQAHLIETLSAIGRETIDIYFLRVRRAVEEFQISGVLQALEMARQEGHVRHIGLCCDGPALATLGLWQFHDAFEVVLLPRNHYDATVYDTLSPLARERRVGVVTSRPLNWGYGIPFTSLPALWRMGNLTRSFYQMSISQAVVADLTRENPVMVGVRSAKEVMEASQAPSMVRPEGLSSMLDEFRVAFDREETWQELLEHSDVRLRDAARRRQAARA